MAKIISIFLLIVLVVLGVVFHKPILHASHAYVTSQKANPYIRNRQWEKVQAVYEKALKSQPDNRFIALSLAKLYRFEGKLTEAEELYKKVLKSNPEHLATTLAYANMLQQSESRYQDALILMKKALEKNPKDPKVLSLLGKIYKQAAESPYESRPKVVGWMYDWSIYYYRHSNQYDPGIFQNWFNLGVIYQELELLEKSAIQYCNAIIVSPKSYEPKFNLGLVLVDLGYEDDGFRLLDESVQILSDENMIDMAKDLAEKAQLVKQSVFVENKSDNSLAQKDASELVSPHCL